MGDTKILAVDNIEITTKPLKAERGAIVMITDLTFSTDDGVVAARLRLNEPEMMNLRKSLDEALRDFNDNKRRMASTLV